MSSYDHGLSSSPEVLREDEFLALKGDSTLSMDGSSLLMSGNDLGGLWTKSEPDPSTSSSLIPKPDCNLSMMVYSSTPSLESGSPGRTPFPHRKNNSYDHFLVAPFNSPEDPPPGSDTNIEDILVQEAMKQENAIKLRLSQMSASELTPHHSVIANGNSMYNPNNDGLTLAVMNVDDLHYKEEKVTPKRSYGGGRRRLAPTSTGTSSLLVHDTNAPLTVENLDLKSAERRILGNDKAAENIQTADKEFLRKVQMNSALELLRKVVPGLTDSAEKSEILEETAKYLLFIKGKVGIQYDRDFLLEFLSF